MPCRAARICRQAAALPSQCLWITDDILAAAWSRFARVCRAHTHPTDGRRHGSNVPGPLEAQKRLARRRMGVQTAVASGGSPPAFDMGNLFGLPGFDGRKAGEFKYEPPGARNDHRTDKQARAWFGRGPKRKDNTWETFLDVPGLDVPEQPKVDPVQASKSAFEDLLASIDNNAAVDKQFVASLVDFLQSSANQPEAYNTLRMMQWELLAKQNRMTHATRRVLAKVIIEKVRLHTIDSDETSKIIATWMLHPRALIYSDTIVDILDAATPGDSLFHIVAKTTSQLLQHDFKHHRAAEALPAVTEHWLECLRQCTHLQNPHHCTPEWKAVYEMLSPRIPDMRVLAMHLSTLEPDDLARIILRYWASVMAVPEVAEDGLELTLDRAGKYLIPHRSQLLDKDIMLRDFEHMCQERLADPTPQISHKDGDPIALVDMLDVVRRHGASTANLAHGTMSILMHPNAAPRTPERIHWVIRGSARRKRLGFDGDLATDVIHHLLNAGFVDYAYEVFADLPGLPLSRCYQLPLAISTLSHFPRYKLWRCLQRQTGDDIVSRAQRSEVKLTLTQDHIDLIHLVAHNVSLSDLPWRMAFRRVEECYLYLRDRSAPINRTITRAMVHAAVIRPLQEGHDVSRKRFHFILSLVKQVEGLETAEALDRVVYNLTRVLSSETVQSAQDTIAGTMDRTSSSPIEEDYAAIRKRLRALGRAAKMRRAWLFQHTTTRRLFRRRQYRGKSLGRRQYGYWKGVEKQTNNEIDSPTAPKSIEEHQAPGASSSYDSVTPKSLDQKSADVKGRKLDRQTKRSSRRRNFGLYAPFGARRGVDATTLTERSPDNPLSSRIQTWEGRSGRVWKFGVYTPFEARQEVDPTTPTKPSPDDHLSSQVQTSEDRSSGTNTPTKRSPDNHLSSQIQTSENRSPSANTPTKRSPDDHLSSQIQTSENRSPSTNTPTKRSPDNHLSSQIQTSENRSPSTNTPTKRSTDNHLSSQIQTSENRSPSTNTPTKRSPDNHLSSRIQASEDIDTSGKNIVRRVADTSVVRRVLWRGIPPF